MQLPTEWVTGETRASSMYETCWYKWNVSAAIDAFCISAAGSAMPIADMAPGVKHRPSLRIAIGAKIQNDNIVIIVKSPIDPPTCTPLCLISVSSPGACNKRIYHRVPWVFGM
jgi:hypothetical protein